MIWNTLENEAISNVWRKIKKQLKNESSYVVTHSSWELHTGTHTGHQFVSRQSIHIHLFQSAKDVKVNASVCGHRR